MLRVDHQVIQALVSGVILSSVSQVDENILDRDILRENATLSERIEDILRENMLQDWSVLSYPVVSFHLISILAIIDELYYTPSVRRHGRDNILAMNCPLSRQSEIVVFLGRVFSSHVALMVCT